MKVAARWADTEVVDVLELPPLTGSRELDPWRIRYRLLLAGELDEPKRERDQRTTLSERMLWSVLEPEPHGWQREYVTGPFRLDFYCPLARLAVEVDGGSHLGHQARERDALRDEWHKARSITTMRVSSDHVERDLSGVLQDVRRRVRLQMGDPEPEVSAPPPTTAPLRDLAAGMLEQAEALRSDLQQQVDALVAAVPEAVASDVAYQTTEPNVAPVVDDQGDVASSQAADQDLEQEEVLVAAQVRMALLVAAAGSSDAAAGRETRRLIAQACRTILPARREQFVQNVLRRAGLSRRPRPS